MAMGGTQRTEEVEFNMMIAFAATKKSRGQRTLKQDNKFLLRTHLINALGTATRAKAHFIKAWNAGLKACSSTDCAKSAFMRFMRCLPAIFLVVLCVSCNQADKPPQKTASATPAPATPAGPAVDKSTAGAILGQVVFKGPIGRPKTIDMTQDPSCPTEPQAPDVLIVNNGKLANVFIYVKDGLGQFAFPTPNDPSVLDQKGCRYAPHVLGLMTGQPLKIMNSDLTLHNIHPMPRNNPDWNESQMARGTPLVKTFQRPELMMPVQCNQHPWMKAYVNVLPHPYFAVSGPDGSFQIKDLPPGEYTLAAVHEKLGEQDLKIKVGTKETVKVSIGFVRTE